MSTALDYMDYTEILEAAVCDRKDCVRSLQEEFIASVQDTTWFEREHAVNEHCYTQHIPWDDDDDVTRKRFWIIMHLCAISDLAPSFTCSNERLRNARTGRETI